ncbi:phosphatidylinositol-4- kinase, partial [Linnemannia zychae]
MPERNGESDFAGISDYVLSEGGLMLASGLQSPGGNINFESSPFKLASEMIQTMGSSVEDQGYRWFCELCAKAFLASRPYTEQIMQLVSLMFESGLPCFRGETIKRMRSHFQLDRSERSAADFILERVDESYLNKRTV